MDVLSPSAPLNHCESKCLSNTSWTTGIPTSAFTSTIVECLLWPDLSTETRRRNVSSVALNGAFRFVLYYDDNCGTELTRDYRSVPNLGVFSDQAQSVRVYG